MPTAATSFTDSNSNAWLLGVTFDQGVRAEDAWDAPYLLKQRLGHLNMRRIAKTPLSKLRSAIKGGRTGPRSSIDPPGGMTSSGS
jgi:hypothetical protein